MAATKSTKKKSTTEDVVEEKVDTAVDTTTDEINVDRFNAFRDRAIAVRGKSTELNVSNEPFILGEAEGFDRVISIPKPSFKTRVVLEVALAENDILRILKIMFGIDVDYILNTLDAYEEETGEAAADVLFGILYAYFEHFWGPGATKQAFTNLSI